VDTNTSEKHAASVVRVKVIKEIARLCGQGAQECGYSEPGEGKEKEKPCAHKQESTNNKERTMEQNSEKPFL
jgi:hypothetical protein